MPNDNLPPPEHMDRWTRNRRLYEYLLGMGLFCSPIFTDESGEKIDALHVSVDLPNVQLTTVPTAGVAAPVKRTEVGGIVRTAERSGNNVIHLPPIV